MAKNSKEVDKLIAEAESIIIQELKADNLKLLKQVDKLKNKKADLIEAMFDAVRMNLATWAKPKIPTPTSSKKSKNEEVAVAILSDIQLAKVTPDYDSDIAEERVVAYAHKIVELTNLQRNAHPVNKCAVLVAGDIVEGELIFPGQSHMIDASLYRQVTVDGPRILHKFLSILLTEFEEVEVYWVIGNHGALGGRSRKDYNPETNADRMLGRILKMRFAS